SGKCEGDDLRRIAVPRDGNDDELLSVGHVGHRGTGGAARKLGLPDDLPGSLVERPEHLATCPGRCAWYAASPALAEKHERPGDERRHAPRLTERREVERLQRGMIARPIAIGGSPEDVALVQIDGDQTAVRRLQDRQTVRQLEVACERRGSTN